MVTAKRLIWHYTNGSVINDIVQSGHIDLAKAGIARNERAAAWFSTNPTWESSANRGNMSVAKGKGPETPGEFMLNTDDLEVVPFDPKVMDELFGGRFRIGVLPEAAPHSWPSFKRLSGIDKKVATAMEEGIGFGNPHEWRASFAPVERRLWRTIERCVEGIWVTHLELTTAPAGTMNKQAS